MKTLKSTVNVIGKYYRNKKTKVFYDRFDLKSHENLTEDEAISSGKWEIITMTGDSWHGFKFFDEKGRRLRKCIDGAAMWLYDQDE